MLFQTNGKWYPILTDPLVSIKNFFNTCLDSFVKSFAFYPKIIIKITF